MIHYKILEGQYRGLIGRFTERFGHFLILLVQGRDQWFLVYVRPQYARPIRNWGLNNNYVEELV